MQMVKVESVTEIIVPRYNELSVERIWPLVQVAEDLNSYFPDYSSHQFPDRKFMYTILGTFRSRLFENIIKEARKQIQYEKIKKLMTLCILSQQYLKRSSLFWFKKVRILSYDNLLVAKGNAVYLLRRSAKLKSERKPTKQY